MEAVINNFLLEFIEIIKAFTYLNLPGNKTKEIN